MSSSIVKRIPYADFKKLPKSEQKKLSDKVKNSKTEKPNRKFNVRKGKAEFVRIAKGLENLDVEEKYKDVNSPTNAASTTAVIFDCCNISQGDTVNTRDGDECRWKKFEMRWTMSVSSLDGTNFIRVILFQWYPPSVPSVANILLTAGVNGIYSNYGEPYQGRYSILYDSSAVVLNTVNQPNQSSPHIVVVPKRKKVNYDPGATTGNNHIYILFVSDSGSATHPILNYTTRIWFNDAEKSF